MNPVAHIMGLDNPSGAWYLFWSGFAGNVEKIAIIGGVVAFLRKHNCHEHRCWRMGRHPIGNTGVIVCRHHLRRTAHNQGTEPR